MILSDNVLISCIMQKGIAEKNVDMWDKWDKGVHDQK